MATARTLAASATRTTSGAGASIDLNDGDPDESTLRLTLTLSVLNPNNNTNAFHLPTMRVAIETSDDDAAWKEVGRFEELQQLPTLIEALQRGEASLPKTYSLAVGGLRRYARATWKFAGGSYPSGVTFSVAGTSI